ncbi:MAG: nitrogen fixation protein [Methylicorpusculum sp.]|uniref:NifB/NifX family molybdenum-iron cluster-binding protein n=1 Tax=Methylicorpusculum sp. TaxID=2713644 RepID=UPI00272F1426|nr:nitrogen fixation protein [Methylicorpusculum sp.]MDP2200380.1 nitrogen fixation protein [Methylicorpusculum sp.]
MTEKLIALAVGDDGNLAPHAGRALRWMVYVVSDATEPSLAWTLDLTDAGSLHEWHVRGDGNRHPLHYVDVAIAGSAGDGVKRNLLQRNTTLLTTVETLPINALEVYRTGVLTEGLPHQEQQCQKTDNS